MNNLAESEGIIDVSNLDLRLFVRMRTSGGVDEGSGGSTVVGMSSWACPSPVAGSSMFPCGWVGCCDK